MAVEGTKTAKVRVYLNAGSNPGTGKMIVKNTLVGYMAPAADADKILTVTNSLAPCLEYPVIQVERVVATTIEP